VAYCTWSTKRISSPPTACSSQISPPASATRNRRGEVALVEHTYPWAEHGLFGDAELAVAVAVVAEIPSADVDRAVRVVVELDRIAKRRGGAGEDLVDDHVERRTPPTALASAYDVLGRHCRIAVVAGQIDNSRNYRAIGPRGHGRRRRR